MDIKTTIEVAGDGPLAGRYELPIRLVHVVEALDFEIAMLGRMLEKMAAILNDDDDGIAAARADKSRLEALREEIAKEIGL